MRSIIEKAGTRQRHPTAILGLLARLFSSWVRFFRLQRRPFPVNPALQGNFQGAKWLRPAASESFAPRAPWFSLSSRPSIVGTSRIRGVGRFLCWAVRHGTCLN